MISSKPTEPSKTGRLTRYLLAPLALFAAGALYVGVGPATPSAISLEIGSVFVQEIVDFLGMEIHTITLLEPDSEWGTLAAGLAEFKLEVDMTMKVLPFGGGKFGLMKATLGKEPQRFQPRHDTWVTVGARAYVCGAATAGAATRHSWGRVEMADTLKRCQQPRP